MAKIDKNAQDQEKESITSGISKKFKQTPLLYIGSVVILLLVVVTFVGGDLLSGGRYGRGGGDLTFGYYDRAPISWVPGNVFQQYYDRIMNYYRSQGVDANDVRYESHIWRQAYEFAAVHTAIIQVMKKTNYTVPDKTVDRSVAKLGQFQDNGRFSPALYNQMSDSSRRSLWRQTQEDITKAVFFDDLTNMLMSSAEVDFIANMASTVRSFDMVSFKVDDYPASEYLAFAHENAELFNSIHLSKISISSEREAKRIRDSVINGTTLFEDAAMSQSQDNYADRGGDMGNMSYFELEYDIPNVSDRQNIFALASGDLSEVINSGNSWAFFRIENEMTEANFDDLSVMEKVRTYVRNYQRGSMEDWAIAQARDFINAANESGFDNAARVRSLEKQSFGPLPINYAGVQLFTTLASFTIPGLNSQQLGDIASNENFWKISFSTELNTPSEPFVQGNNVFVFYPTEQKNAEEETVSGVAAAYSDYWLDNVIDRSLQPYFLNHAKMEDNFWEVYSRVFRQQ